MLYDAFNRLHNYLRISLTERCNLRCTYCMPEEGILLRDRREFMTQEETLGLARSFVSLGVTKIRLTGGEPLIKKNFAGILEDLSALPVQLALTTNGILLDQYWDHLEKAGLQLVNISLDSLRKERVDRITRRSYFDRIRANIETGIERGFDVRLNCVLMKGENDDEIIDFIEFTKTHPVTVRFIEFMPFDGNQWNFSRTVPYRQILERVYAHFGSEGIRQQDQEPNGTARNFQVAGYQGRFGIISSVTNPFCDGCNRIRLTADGKLKNCLFSGKETDLLTALRNGEDIVPLIRSAIANKEKERAGLPAFESPEFEASNRSMVRIGG